MPSGPVLAAAAIVVMAWYAGVGIVHGVKAGAHKVGCAFHHCEKKADPPPQP